MTNHELSKEGWLEKAAAYCARAEHCAADVRRKLYEWQAPSKIADSSAPEGLDLFDFIEEKLRENDFLNDSRFCHAYVHDKVEYQSWGRYKIQAGLRALELPESDIRDALDSIDETTYFSHLRSLIASRRSDSEDKRLRFLLQRGFSHDEIKKALM